MISRGVSAIIRILSVCLLIGMSLHAAAQSLPPVPGDKQTDRYLPLLKGKRVALFANHTAMLGKRHLLDVLLDSGITVRAIFVPEHGFRGNADAGEAVSGHTDAQTGIPVFSLYNGKNKRPTEAAMKQFDILLIDIQDVGLRFYTYYITMYHLMDACASHDKEVLVLDRPNPNGMYVDGPILRPAFKSGVGILPIPIVHGMTLGELAQMINGEHWLPEGRACRLNVIRCLNYTHRTRYKLPIPPSPNLPCMKAVYLYPSTCLFEGTVVSLGRGTDLPFQVYGHPDIKPYDYSFTPRSRPGAKHPPMEGRQCYGTDLSTRSEDEIIRAQLDLSYVIDAYQRLNIGERFFTSFFDMLAGTDSIRQMILQGRSAADIRASWKKDTERFKLQRKPYLLYDE